MLQSSTTNGFSVDRGYPPSFTDTIGIMRSYLTISGISSVCIRWVSALEGTGQACDPLNAKKCGPALLALPIRFEDLPANLLACLECAACSCLSSVRIYKAKMILGIITFLNWGSVPCLGLQQLEQQ